MHRRNFLKISSLLLGGTVSASLTRALLADGRLTAGDKALLFTDTQERTIHLLADMIIPPTDTPGAVAAGVPDFIATIVSDWYTPRERQVFFEGLAALDEFCLKHDAKSFNDSPESARVVALQHQEEIAKNYQSPAPSGGRLTARQEEDENAPFFKKIKELVVLGYYTSEVGAKQELIYEPMPMKYDGDVDFSTVGRQWIS